MSHRTIPPPLPGTRSRQDGETRASLHASPLADLVGRARGLFVLGALGRTVTWLVILAIALIVTDVMVDLSESVRFFAWLVFALTAAGLLIRYAWLPTKRYDTDAATRDVEAAHPEMGQMLRTANDIAALPNLARAGISPELAGILMRQARVKMQSMDLSAVLPRRATENWLILGCASLIGLIILVSTWQDFRTGFVRLLSPGSHVTFSKVELTTARNDFTRAHLPQVSARVTGRATGPVTVFIHEADGSFTELPMEKSPEPGGYEAVILGRDASFIYHVVSGDGRSNVGFMENRDPAQLVASSATVAPPAYAGLPEKEFANADVSGIEGSQVDLRFEFSAPMRDATLHFPDGTVTRLSVRSSEAGVTRELASGEMIYRLEGTDRGGRRIEPVAFRMNGEVDAMPVVKIVDPAKDASVTAIAEIPVRISVKDDHGIASFGLILEAQGKSIPVVERRLDSKDEIDLTEVVTAAMEAFPLSIRDNVRLYAYATDHKPRGEVRAVSPLKNIDIKQFKLRSMMAKGSPGGKKPPGAGLPAEEVVKLGKLIGMQRVLVSDTFVEREKFAGSLPSLELGAQLADRQAEIRGLTDTLAKTLAGFGLPADDQTLFRIASQQMDEASNGLSLPDLARGFEREDAALSSLLELRKHLIELIIKGQEGEGQSEGAPKPFADLAAEAERLATEEREVGAQLGKEPQATELDAMVKRQELALADAGELLSNLIDHPEKTDLLVERMSEAEETMDGADRALGSGDPSQALPQLDQAAMLLDEVAKHLRALDEGNKAETLADLAEVSKEAAAAAKPLPKDGGESAAISGEEPPAAPPSSGKPPGDLAAKGEGEAPGESKGEGEGQGEGSGSGKGNGGGKGTAGGKPADGKSSSEQRAEALAKSARDAETTEDVLKHLAAKEDPTGESGRLEELRKESNSENLAKDLAAAGKAQGDGKGDSPEARKSAEGLASRLDKLADGLEAEKQRMARSKLEELSKLEAEARSLREQAEAAQPGAPGGGESPGPPSSSPGKGGAAGSGSQPGSPGQAGSGESVAALASELAQTGDPELKRIASSLQTGPQKLPEQLEPLVAAEQRLTILLDELIKHDFPDTGEGKVPLAYKRAVDDYFRALSDDFPDDLGN